MKKIFFIGMISLFLLRNNNIFSTETQRKQTWGEWARSWLRAIPAKGALTGVATGYGYSKIAPEMPRQVGAIALASLGIEIGYDDWDKYETAILGLGTIAFMGFFIWGFSDLENQLKERKITREQIKQKIHAFLNALLSNSRLYPTYTSKLHALSTQTDFIDSEFYQNELFQTVCKKMITSMVDVRESLNKKLEEDWNQPYYFGKTKEEWKQDLAKEKEIDNYIIKFRQPIQHLPLESQINTLEQIELGKSSSNTYLNYRPEMAAFESVYGRLRLKIEISRMLIGEEKSKLDPFDLEKIKRMTPEEKQKPVISWKHWESSNEAKARALREKMKQAAQEREHKIEEIKKARDEAKAQQAAQ